MTIQGGDIVALFSGGWLESVGTPIPPSGDGTPTVLDTRMGKTVDRLITKYGKAATFWVYPDAEYDPAIGKKASGDAAQYSKKIIPPYAYEEKWINGDTIRAGDMRTGVAGKDIEFEPAKGMKITFGDQVWTIVLVSPVYTGERIALYLMQMRK